MNLIYLLSVGTGGDRVVRCCIESLISVGKFTGDIFLFTDHDIDIPGVVLKPIEHEFSHDFESISMLRVKVGLQLDLQKYENVMYLDTDHLAFDDINCFFNTDGKLWGMKEGGRHLSDSSFHGGYLNENEIKNNDGTCYCSGILCGPTVLFQNALREWHKAYQQPFNGVSKYREQSALNIAIYRQSIKINSYPSIWLEGARSNSYSCFSHLKMVHFWDRTKNEMVRIWRKRRVNEPSLCLHGQ